MNTVASMNAHELVPSVAASESSVRVPLPRVRALLRALFHALGAGLCWLLLRLAATFLNFGPSGASNRIEDYALLIALVPVAGVGAWLLWRGMRWLLLACWSGKLGIEAHADRLVLAFGPFGSCTLDAARLSAVYLFEIGADEVASDQFEAHLPEAVQRATLVPRLAHPNCPFLIRERMLDLLGLDEADLAPLLRPVVSAWRGEAPEEPLRGEAGSGPGLPGTRRPR